jgi:hypothetical protein
MYVGSVFLEEITHVIYMYFLQNMKKITQSSEIMLAKYKIETRYTQSAA